MKSLWNAVSVFIVLHLLLLIFGAAWLRWTDRLDQSRIHRVVDMFKVTITQQELDEQEAEAQAQSDAVEQEHDAWLQTVSAGPLSVNDRLATQQEAEELRAERVRRLEADLESLRRQLDISRRELAREREKLERDRESLEAAAERTREQLADEDFQRALAMYQRVRPRQAKEMFVALIDQGEADQVVTYLTAMQEKKASDILQEFKTAPEIAQATDLVERIRQREHLSQAGPGSNGANRPGGAM